MITIAVIILAVIAVVAFVDLVKEGRNKAEKYTGRNRYISRKP